MSAEVVLACDLGGSSFRAGLIDGQGRVLGQVSRAADLAGDPALWWRALIEAVTALADEAAFGRVSAIAISAVTRTQVLLDREGVVLRPALLWRDTSAQAHLGALRAMLPVHAESGAMNAFHPLARLFALSRTEGEVLARAACVVEPKDFLNFRLTGRVAIDQISGARLIASADLLAVLGLDPGLVPEVLAPTDVVGVVRSGLPGALGRLAGVSVLAMATDTWAAVLGLGAMRRGIAYNLSGTTEVLGLMDRDPVVAEGLITIGWGEGLFQIGGPSQTGADSLAWLSGVIGHPVSGLEGLLAQAGGAQPVLFLPYLQGERVPYWDPALRGAFIGLHRSHGPADLALAVLEGVAFLNRIVLGAAEAACGGAAREVRFGGGGAASAAWCQIKADVLNRPVVVVDEAEPGLIGAAIVAFASLGVVADLEDGQSRLVRPRRRFLPVAERVAWYDRLFPQFRAAEAGLAPISRALAQWGTNPV